MADTYENPEYNSRGMAVFFTITMLAALVLLVAVRYQSTHQEWKEYQIEYRALAIESAHNSGNPALIDAAERIEIGLKQHQLFLEDLGRIDRCTVCHLGVESSFVEAGSGGNKVFAKHPGDYLVNHPIEQFGCTSCHDGQGLATNSYEAHAVRDTDVHGEPIYWEKPMLKGAFIEANCLKCHSTIIPKEAPTLARGKKLFDESGCLGCHKLNNRGGARGPGFDGLGDVSKHVKHVVKETRDSYLHETNHNHNLSYILEAVRDPKAQPTHSKMIDLGFSPEDELALTVYLKGLVNEKVPSSLLPTGYGVEAEDGKSLYLKYCSACHGSQGEGKIFEELAKKPVRLGSSEFLSIVSPKLLTRITETGKRGGVMPAWATTGGLSDEQIQKVVRYIYSWRGEAIPYPEVAALTGDAKKGAALFQSNCSVCHGHKGKYEDNLIGPSLNNQQFLAVAGEEFLYRTIVNGRPETAMPSWRSFSASELAHLMSFMQSWRTPAPTEQAVLDGIVAVNNKINDPAFSKYKKKRLVKSLDALYGRNCSGCHGRKGKGGVGPSLNNQEFLAIADERFLYKTLTTGRHETAMPSFHYFSADELARLIVKMKTWQTVPSETLSKEPVYGSELLGERIFNRQCTQCHGIYGEGGTGPAILRIGFLDVASDGFIRRMIEKGRGGTPMRGMAKGEHGMLELSDPELDGLVAFMRSRQRHPVAIPVGRQYRGDQVDDSVARGKKLYTSCAACHGPDGGGFNGPALGNPGFLDNATDGFIIAMAMLGRHGTAMAPQGAGTGGNADLSSQDVIDLVNYIRSWQGRDDIPGMRVQGDPVLGATLYKANCSQCHGLSGKEGFAPSLNNKDFMEVATDGYLQATMALGRWGTAMQSVVARSHGMEQLRTDQINHIIVYLRAMASGADIPPLSGEPEEGNEQETELSKAERNAH